MPKHNKFQCDKVKEKFDTYPKDIKQKILFLRQLIIDVAS